MARRTTGTAAAGAALAAAALLASCTAPSPEPTPTPTPPPVYQAEVRLPAEPTTVLAGATDAELAVAASSAFYASAPVAVVSAPEPDAQLRAAAVAVALGAPMLVEPLPVELPAEPAPADATDQGAVAPADPAAEPTAEPADPPAPTDPLGDEVRRLGALAVVTVGEVLIDLPGTVTVIPAPDDDAALAELLRVTLAPRPLADPAGEVAAVGALDRTAPALITYGPPPEEPTDGATGEPAEQPDEQSTEEATVEPASKPTPDPTAEPTPEPELPLTELPEAPDGGLLLTTGDPTELAAVATARAAGIDVVVVPSGDPRVLPDTVHALAAADATTVIATGDVFGTPEDLAWKVATAATGVELPGGGQVLFPGRRFVAMYGSPGIPALGILGEQDAAASIVRAQGLAAAYQPLTTDVVVPAFEIIATIADRPAGADGNYSNELPAESFVPWVEAAQAAGVYVVLDLQPGRTDFLTQAKLYESLLLYPNVGLALDPEWRLGPNQVHLRQIGSVHVDEINAVIAYLSELTRANHLPQKLLVLHQFMQRMIVSRELVNTADPAVQVLIHADGQGSQGGKAGTWANLQTGAPPGVAWGWKNFIDEDKPMATPEQTYQVQPTPQFVSYQ